jgi:hypothetical protein
MVEHLEISFTQTLPEITKSFTKQLISDVPANGRTYLDRSACSASWRRYLARFSVEIDVTFKSNTAVN